MSGYYKDRDESQVAILAREIFSDLNWWFSDKCAEVNGAFLSKNSNNVAWLNAYASFAHDGEMIWDGVSDYKRGCSFWGRITKSEWKMIPQMDFCIKKAREILHVYENN